MLFYYHLKIAHIIVACLLLSACAWSFLPAFRLFGSARWWCCASSLRAMFQRGLWVIPLGVFQAGLGMAALSFEPSAVPLYEAAVLLGGFFLLGFFWLAGIGVIKYLELTVRQQRRIDQQLVKKTRIFMLLWLSLLVLVFMVMLFTMVNVR
jgi:hypothetical protein